MMNTEIWKDLPSYKGLYQVSSRGNIRRACDSVHKKCGEEISQATDALGYKTVNLINKTKKTHKVHRLIMLAFVGESDLEVNHKDGNKANNNLSNLEYCTRSENVLHSFRVLGRSLKGEKHSQARLTDLDIYQIFELRKNGTPVVNIAKRFGMNAKTISNILNGHTWQHITHDLREAT